jgi:hypothetical protein
VAFCFACPATTSDESEKKAQSILRVHLSALFAAIAVDAVSSSRVIALGRRWQARAFRAAPVRAALAVYFGIPALTYGEMLRWFKDSML